MLELADGGVADPDRGRAVMPDPPRLTSAAVRVLPSRA